MPGLLLVVTVAETARRGFRAGPMIVLGHAVLELLLVVLLVFGLAAVLGRDEVKIIIGLVGGIVLLYFGWGMFRDAVGGRVSLDLSARRADVPAAAGGIHPVAAGALVSVMNPCWIIWWATVGLWYITQALQDGIVALAFFYIGHIMADVIWYCLVAAVVAGGRRFISDKIYRGVLVACGIFIVGLGVFFIKDGIINII